MATRNLTSVTYGRQPAIQVRSHGQLLRIVGSALVALLKLLATGGFHLCLRQGLARDVSRLIVGVLVDAADATISTPEDTILSVCPLLGHSSGCRHGYCSGVNQGLARAVHIVEFCW